MKGGFRLAFAFASLLLVWPAATWAGSAKDTLTGDNRLQILRVLAYEYATTLQPLPASRGEKEALELNAAGEINEKQFRQTLANRGAAIQPGDIVQITGVEFRRDSILFEINGGGKKKKKWYQRISVQGGSGGTISPGGRRTGSPPRSGESDVFQGSWIVVNFPGHIPEVSGEEVKKLLSRVLDFSRQSAAVPWIETLPAEFREAIKNKKAVVGMNREMVLAALGRPDRKVREVKNDQETEDWLYGNPPFVTFVTFVGEQVVEVKEFR